MCNRCPPLSPAEMKAQVPSMFPLQSGEETEAQCSGVEEEEEWGREGEKGKRREGEAQEGW